MHDYSDSGKSSKNCVCKSQHSKEENMNHLMREQKNEFLEQPYSEIIAFSAIL